MTEAAARRLGIFSRTFERSNLADVLDAVKGSGFQLVHFNFRSAGLPTMPADLTPLVCQAVRHQLDARNLTMVGISATFNAVHPDRERREHDTSLACDLIAHCPLLGTDVVSLCTGTRDPEDMWRWHPDNATPSAWDDLCRVLDQLLDAARSSNVVLGIEPERNNVVSSAGQARRLLDLFHDGHLKIILDPANLLTPLTARNKQSQILAEAFSLLHGDIIMAHAKDLSDSGDIAAGRGLLDYELYFRLLAEHGIDCPVVLHELAEADVPRARTFVLSLIQRHTPGARTTSQTPRAT